MATRAATHDEVFPALGIRSPTAVEALRVLALVGRIFYSAIVILSAPGHLSGAIVPYAAKAGVPSPELLVPISGVLALAGGLSILLGWHARIGALLLVVFLIPVTLWMHRFWGLSDPAAAAMQQVNFMKNLAMLGAALFLLYFGAGPLSLDARRMRAAPQS